MIRPVAIFVVTVLLALISLGPAIADENATVSTTLQSANAYISPNVTAIGHIQPGDLQRLDAQATSASKAGIPEKFAVLRSIPSRFRGTQGPAYQAAKALRATVGLNDGVMILVFPEGIGVSSSRLNESEISAIERHAAPICNAQSYTACVIAAGKEAATRIQSDDAANSRNAGIFWFIVLLILAAIIGFFVWRAAQTRRRMSSRLGELREAASNTLSMADTAIQDIETSGKTMESDVRAEYDRALGLRDRARREVESASTQAALSQANQDAAQAVLALQGVMRSIGVTNPLVDSGLDLPGHRCFYCGRDDRPPYTERVIDDGRGNTMTVEVCAYDMSQLESGRTPQVVTVQQGGTVVPWWATPNTPYYYAYGGPTWQYWLPFMIGMDVGGWFGGGGYGPGYGYGYGDPGWGGNADWGGDPSGGISGDTMDPSSDQGAGDFGGWAGGDPGAGDFSGGDFGGAGDFGGGSGDFGGGDFGGGGGDFGGGDFGGGGGDWS